MNGSSRHKLLLIIFTVIIVLFLNRFFANDFLSYGNLQMYRDQIVRGYLNSPVLYIILYVVTYILVSALALPGAAMLSLLGGSVFGFGQGVILVILAATVGSTLAFLMSRYFFKEQIEARLKDKIIKINNELEENGIYYLFFLRLNPIIPFVMVNSLMGLTNMKTWPFFYISFLGMLPGTLLYVNAGAQLSKITAPSDLLTANVLISFFAIGLFPLTIKKITKWIRR